MSVLLPRFNAKPDIFAVMNRCVVALSLFPPTSSLLRALIVYKIRGVRVEEYAYYVNKLRQNIGLEWTWRHKQRAPNTNDHHMPLNEIPMKIFCVRHCFYVQTPNEVRSRNIVACMQGSNKVRWHARQEASLAPPCSNLRFFWSKFTVLKNVHVTLLGLFDATRSHLAPP